MEDRKIKTRWTGIKNSIDEFGIPYQEKVIIEQINYSIPFPFELRDTFEIKYYDISGKDVGLSRVAYSLASAKRDALRDTGYKSKDFVWIKEVLD